MPNKNIYNKRIKLDSIFLKKLHQIKNRLAEFKLSATPKTRPVKSRILGLI